MEEPEGSHTEPRYEGEEDDDGEEAGQEEKEDGARGDLHVRRGSGGEPGLGVEGGDVEEREGEGEEGEDDAHHDQPDGQCGVAGAAVGVQQSHSEAAQAEQEPDQARHQPDPPGSQAQWGRHHRLSVAISHLPLCPSPHLTSLYFTSLGQVLVCLSFLSLLLLSDSVTQSGLRTKDKRSSPNLQI